jgi:hypothetical protein
MPNCIQHGYDTKEIAARLDVIALLCQSIPVYRLPFVPTAEVVTLVKAHV